ncbi:MAG: DUF721 domain-containing protein [Aeoliella sp.]
MQQETAEKLAYLAKRSAAQQRRFHARLPQTIGKVIGQLVMSKGYACGKTDAQFDSAWAEVVTPEIAAKSKPTGVRRGKLEVTVAHSALMQELSFDQRRIATALRTALPEAKITGVKFSVGKIERNNSSHQ